jgi:hypothetical protein
VTVDIPREFIKKDIKYNDLEKDIAELKNIIKDFDKKPILNLKILDVESDTSRIYEIIKEEIGDLALMIRPTFEMLDEKTIIIDENQDRLGPEQLIEKTLEGYGSKKVTDLAIDLYHLLSKDKLDESQEIINQFFNDQYINVAEDVEFKTEEVKKPQPPEEKEDVQVTFSKEVSE